MDNVQGRFCPVCKHKNEPDAILCAHCGAMLEADITDKPRKTTNKLTKATAAFPKEPPRIKTDVLIPEGSIAIFLLDNPKPIAIMSAGEFVLGRQMEGSLEEIVDLTPYGAFAGGVSRRHAMIVRKKNGFQIIDLDSTNGSWLNEKRLVPTKAYPLPNGAMVRLGQIRLQIITGKISQGEVRGEELSR
jgi:hypothetical protein